jgi:hypothetical protein
VSQNTGQDAPGFVAQITHAQCDGSDEKIKEWVGAQGNFEIWTELHDVRDNKDAAANQAAKAYLYTKKIPWPTEPAVEDAQQQAAIKDFLAKAGHRKLEEDTFHVRMAAIRDKLPLQKIIEVEAGKAQAQEYGSEKTVGSLRQAKPGKFLRQSKEQGDSQRPHSLANLTYPIPFEAQQIDGQIQNHLINKHYYNCQPSGNKCIAGPVPACEKK